MYKSIFGFVWALLITGCATTPVPASQATVVPNDRLVAFQERTTTTSSTLIVTRDEGLIGSGCFYSFLIDGVVAARFATSETARFYVAPGEHRLRVGRDLEGRGLCGTDRDAWTQRETLLRAGEQKSFRLSIDANGATDIQRSD